MTTLTSSGDNRQDRSKSVGATKVLEFVTSISENTKTLNIPQVSGQVLGIEYICPNLTTDTTFDLTFLTENGATIIAKTGLADSKASGFFVDFVSDNIFISQNSKLKASFTTAQVAIIEVILHMK